MLSELIGEIKKDMQEIGDEIKGDVNEINNVIAEIRQNSDEINSIRNEIKKLKEEWTGEMEQLTNNRHQAEYRIKRMEKYKIRNSWCDRN